MKKRFYYVASFVFTSLFFQNAIGQNTSPYWSLAGNSNAATTSKLGTTNAVNLRLYTNNVERVRILSTNGFVGIGTTAPTDRLHINTTAGTNALRVQINGNTKLLVHSGGGVAIGANTAPPANGLYVSGNVGIATTAPTAKLHITGSSPYVTAMQLNNGGIRVDNTWGTGDSSVGIYSESGTGIFGKGMTGVQGDGMTGVYGSGYSGVTGQNWQGSTGYGVSGYSTDGTGVYANSSAGIGIDGFSNSNYAGQFVSAAYRGIYVQSGAGWYAGYFNGDIYTTGTLFQSSDSRLKKNIADFENAMTIINKLQPKNYEYRNDGNYAKLNLPKGTHYGLIAQDVEKVLPNLVKDATTNTRNMEAGKKLDDNRAAAQQSKKPDAGVAVEMKGVSYVELIPIVIKGMQEQEQHLNELDEKTAEITDLKARIETLEALVRGVSGTNISVTSLSQAMPNPVKGSTRISYTIPTNSRAQLLLTDATGKTIKVVTLTNSGYTNLNTVGLSSGIYNYSLVVDGKAVETKKMTVLR